MITEVRNSGTCGVLVLFEWLLLLLFTSIPASSMSIDHATGRKIGMQSKPPYEERCLFFDNDIIVYEKPPNMLSVPGTYDKDSLASRIAASFCIERQDQMIVHRLDYHTSGVICFARNKYALKDLHRQFRSKRSAIYKRYIAKIAGHMETFDGEIDLPINRDHDRGPPFCKVGEGDTGKSSQTRWQVLSCHREDCSTLVYLFPTTGRTHQLRIHMAAIGHPILGDEFYAPQDVVNLSPKRLCLHAESLRIIHPRLGHEMEFCCDPRF